MTNYILRLFKNEIYVIDVSQSVEHDHPHALDFLRKDCTNINDFFKKKGVPVMTVKELFDFVTDPTVKEENMDEYLERSMEIASNRSSNEPENLEDEIFKKSFIPYTMNDVVDFERDFRRVKQGENLIYTTLHGLKEDLSQPRQVPELLKSEESEEKVNKDNEASSDEEDSADEDENDSNEDENDSDESDSEDEGLNEEEKQKRIQLHTRPRDESPNSRKARKNAVKEEKREKRKVKTPKHVKKRAIKVAQMRRHPK